MPRFYPHLPYYLVIFFFYWPLYELFLLVVSDPLHSRDSIATVSVSHFGS